MAVCRFWQQGNCRFGDNCRFEHPSNNQAAPNANRFAPLQSPANPPSRNNNAFNQSGPSNTLPYALDKAAILVDLTSEQPQWILSAYGPGRFAPAQLFGGEREQSFEEMRLLHYIGMASGNPQQAAQQAEKLFQSAQQQMQAAANNLDGAIEFIVNGEKQHPNRLDVVAQTEPTNTQANPFSKNVSPFPSVPKANPFASSSQVAAPAFGAPSAPGGAFGQPSALGPKPSAFAATTPAFGAPTQLGSAGSFGQPSALGQKPSLFTPSNAPAASPFSAFANKPSAFSQQPATTSAFGAPSQPPATSAFGVPSQPASAPAFGTPSQPVSSVAFGQAFGQQSTPFGAQPAQPTNSFSNATPPPFGAPVSTPNNPFGSQTQTQATVSPFGAGNSAQSSNPFAKAPVAASTVNPFAPANPAPPANPFSNAQPSTNNAPNPFNNSKPSPPIASFGQSQPVAPAGSSPFASASRPFQPAVNGNPSGARTLGLEHLDINQYSTRDQNGKLVTFKNKQVVYKKTEEEIAAGDDYKFPGKPGFRRPDGKWERIMFPDGPPAPNKDAAKSPEHYDGNAALKAEYQYAAQNGVFKDGKMPLVPPLREWCSFDF